MAADVPSLAPPAVAAGDRVRVQSSSSSSSSDVVGQQQNGGGGVNSVLSDKVCRALSVRTDTPAMRAALDALAGLSAEDDDDGPGVVVDSGDVDDDGGGDRRRGRSSSSSSVVVIDARSVRAAVERDALRRAIEFQAELRRLADDATSLRERVDDVAKVATMVGERIGGGILDDVDAAGSGGRRDDDDDVVDDIDADASGGVGGRRATTTSTTSTTTKDAWERERDLAYRLASAQRSYVEAVARQAAVNAFLDKFDLKDDEARLLDRYDFVGFLSSSPSGGDDYRDGEEDGMEGGRGDPWNHPNAALSVVANPSRRTMDDSGAFLDALERLTVIRRELTKAFGSGADPAADASSFDLERGDIDVGTSDDGTGGTGGRVRSLGTHSALRMMEQLAARQERAHERLYRFLQHFLGIGIAAPSTSMSMSSAPTSSADAGGRHPPSLGALGRFRDGDEMDEAFHHPLARRAIHVLRHSSARRMHALELVAAGRRTEVTRRFLLALTSGYGGMAPIEMKAHDPVAYVGDMLAFAFRAFRVEGELIDTLLRWDDDGDGNGEGGGGGGGNDGDDEGGGGSSKDATAEGEQADDVAGDTDDDDEDRGYNKPMNAIEMLAQSMGGLARPLRTRISQVVSSLASQGPSRADDHADTANRHGTNDEDDETSSSSLGRLVALFSVCGLLRFYCAAVQKALERLEDRNTSPDVRRAENPLFVTCDECLAEAADSFVASVRVFGAMLPTHSTSSSESEAQLAQRAIVRISEERIASPGFSEDFASSSAEAEDVVSKQLSLPVLVGTMIDAAMPHLRTLDDCAALKSALNVALKCGLKASDSVKWCQLVQETERDLVESFVNAETDEVLQVCGLEGLRSSLQHMNGVYVEGMTMSSHPGLSQRDVELSMKKFYSSLFSPPIPTFEDTIKDPEVRKIARSKTAQRVVDVYRELYVAITGERGGYADLAFMGHDPDQVKTLLSL